jgi:phenylalanyl-tRNA synthetase beta chain
MKISFNWLKTLVNISSSVEETAALLTASGLEVEALENFESLKGGLKGLVVGHILECGKHPDADRLSLTKVDIGKGEPLSIVCGATNVAAGQKVIVATVGTKLYPTSGEPFEIKKSKIRGSLSEGMICAEDEFGLGTSHDGILVLPADTKTGLPAAEYFKIENDTVLEIGLTPNRSDAASHLGVARDLRAIVNSSNENEELQINLSGLQQLGDPSNLNKVEIVVENKIACPRYSGLVISGIKVKESPDWLKNRLKAIGSRPINNIVDITNFVLHELGQPLHAFDLAEIKGNKVVVRNAKEDEKFVTLDGIERTLKGNDLMICDAEKPLCIAGVFGGTESGVTENTNAIFLESAFFDAGYIRKTAKHLGLKTDASFRFERGTDPEMTIIALTRAANLIFELAGGVLSMEVTDLYPEKLEPFKVAFSLRNCNDLIGKELDTKTVKNIIQNLGIEISSEGSHALLLSVPRFKSDVTREADVIEEVMRIYGYNNVEAGKMIAYNVSDVKKNLGQELEEKIAANLEGAGFNEIMSLSLSKESLYPGKTDLVKILNPLSSDLNVLRADMLWSGLEAIAYNVNRKNSDLKFFEIGRTYSLNEKGDFKYAEQKNLAFFVSGGLFQENPYGLKQNANFSFLKGVLNKIFTKCGIEDIKTEESSYENFDYGLNFNLNGKIIAECGAVGNKALKQFGISQNVFYACINFELLLKASTKQRIVFDEIPKFPSVRRDLALLLDTSVKYQEIEALAYSTERKLLKDVNLFDIYEDKKLGGKKSYAVSFTLLDPEATLTDKQIEAVMDKLIKGYKEKLGAELR